VSSIFLSKSLLTYGLITQSNASFCVLGPSHPHRLNRHLKLFLAKLEDYWLKLRIKDLDVPASHLLNESLSVTAGMPTIEDALNLYLDLKGVGRGELFFRAARRNVRYLVTALGLKTLDKYTTTDASRLREWLLKEQKISTSSVARVFASIKAMTNFAINELGLEIRIHLPVSTSHHQMHRSVTPSALKTSGGYKLSATNRMMNSVILLL
jgi:hypothetical protein